MNSFILWSQLITWELKGVKIDTFKRLNKLLKKGTTADFHQESEVFLFGLGSIHRALLFGLK
jgi:hypothetical protein